MPLQLLWGHGSFRTSYGYFNVPANVRIEFVVDDNAEIDDDAIRIFEYGDLSGGITDELITRAQQIQDNVGRFVKSPGDQVKNYKLESIIGDFLASGAKNALKNDNVWTPGKETNNGEEFTYLRDIVRQNAHRGSVADPLVIQWCACTSNYIGEMEADAPVPAGKKRKVRSSKCYISTATCAALGLPDDSEPLERLRWFRDRVLIEYPDGPADVDAYYQTAPRIVEAIDRGEFPDEVYRGIYRSYLVPALCAIDAGDHDGAYRIYASMVADLDRRYPRSN